MFQREWLYENEFKDWLSGVPGDDLAYCKVCDKDFICNSRSNLRSHANGVRHTRLMNEQKRIERQSRRTSSSRNQSSRNRDRSPMSIVPYASRNQVRERSPVSRVDQRRRQPNWERDHELELFQRIAVQRNGDFDFSERREFLRYSANNDTRSIRRYLEFYESKNKY